MRRFRGSRPQGSLLVFALLLCVIISLISLSLLQLRKASYSSSQSALRTVQARALARSGLGDLWVKIGKDPFFPGGVGDEQSRFSYRENVLGDGGPIGSYSVLVDRSRRLTHEILLVESTGVVGQLDAPIAKFTIYAELSTKPDDFRFKTWQEGVAPRL